MPKELQKTTEDLPNESEVNPTPATKPEIVQNPTPANEPPNIAKPNTAVPDPFDVTNLRLDQSFVESAGVKKLLTTIPVRKPHKQEFIRVHSDPAYRDAFAVIEWQEDKEFYLLTPHVARALPGEFTMVHLFTAINRQDVVTLWPVKLPGSDGRTIRWHTSAAEAAEFAMSHWTRVRANMGLGAYEWAEAEGSIPEPKWPDLSFTDLLRIAFKDRYVGTLDHAILQRIRGA
jgi:hypothetical protein